MPTTASTTACLVAASLLAVAGCGADDPADDEAAAPPDRFCAAFADGGTITSGPDDADTIAQTRAFVTELRDDPPAQVAEEIETLSEGLDALTEAVEAAEAGDGAEALRTIEESDEVSLDDMATAAGTIEDFAVENCDEVDAPE